MPQRASLNTRDIYQCLRKAALGVHTLEVCARHADSLVDVSIQGWRLMLALDAEGLAHCVHCHTPGGQQSGLEDWQRYRTNLVDLLSLRELTCLQ